MKTPYIILLITAVAALMPGTARGEDSFDSIIDRIVENDPAVSAVRSRAAAEISASRAENMLPDPEVDLDYKWGRKDAGNRWGVSVTQSFDWPGLYGARRKEIQLKKAMLEKEYLAAVADARLQVKLTLIDVVNLRSQLAILSEVYTNLDSVTTFLSRAFEHGEATVLMLRKARHDRYSAQLRIDDAESELDRLRASLIALNGGKYIDLSTVKEYPSEKFLSEQEYTEIFTSRDMRLSYGESAREAAEASLKVQKLGRMPRFTLGYVHEKEGSEHFNGFTAAMTLPVWSRKNAVDAASETLKAVADESAATRLTIQSETVSDYALARKLTERIREYDDILGNDYPTLLSKSFAGGQITVFEYLNEMNWYTESKLSFLDLEYRRAQVLARLNKWE